MTNKLIQKFASTKHRRFRCRNFYGKGFCLRGNNCRFNHGLNPIVVDDLEMDNLSVSATDNPPPPGLEEKAVSSTTSFVDLLLTPTVGGESVTARTHRMMFVSPLDDSFPLENALLREMEAQNARIRLEAERKTAQLGMVQQSRRIVYLYEELVEQMKFLLQKLQKLDESAEAKRQQANALVKRIEGTKSALEGLFQQLTDLWAISSDFCEEYGIV